MRFVYKHNESGKYLEFLDWNKVLVDDITEASIFDDDDLVPPLNGYTYISYEKELRKLKLEKINTESQNESGR